jgi:hypothetical protein
MAMYSAPLVREMFREELLQLQSWLLGYSGDAVRELFPAQHLLEPTDFFGARFQDDPPLGTKYYDFPPTGRDYRLGDLFMEDWARHCNSMNVVPGQCRSMIHLFLLHEFYHIVQNLTSDRYQDSDHAPRGLQWIDYLADAYSIHGAYRLYDRFGWWSRVDLQSARWNQRLEWLIQSALRSMEVFNADAPGYPVQQIGQERFVRYSMWHLQHARARTFAVETGDISAFGLIDPPIVEFEKGTSFPAEVVRASDTLPEKTKLFVTWRGRFYRFTSDTSDFARNLRDGILRADTKLTLEAMRELLNDHRDLTGRTAAATPVANYSPLPFSDSLMNVLRDAEQGARDANVRLYTPHLLKSLLSAQDHVALRCFNSVGSRVGEQITSNLDEYLNNTLPNDQSAKGFTKVDWFSRDDIRKASLLASHEGSVAVETRHLLSGILMTESATSELLRHHLGGDRLQELKRYVRNLRVQAQVVATPGIVPSK